MITKSQLKILEAFRRDPIRRFTFSELKEELNESSNNKLQIALADFEREGLILINRKKGFNIITLNIESGSLISYFSLIDLEKLNQKILSLLREIKNVVLEKDSFFSLAVFGSYAKNKFNKNSDLDVVIIFENKGFDELIKPEINSIKRKSLIPIDIHFFSKKEFLEMVFSKKQNLGKEIINNFLAFYGGEFLYNLILKNEFTK